MAGSTEYWYKLHMDASAATATAKAFREQVQKELQSIEAEIDLTVSSKNLGQAAANATKPAAEGISKEMKKAFDTSTAGFTSTMKKFGATDFAGGFASQWERGLIKPSAKAVSSISDAQVALQQFGRATQRIGVSVDDWMGMGNVDRQIAAIQAAQRRIWGLRGYGYQLEEYGRSAMMTSAAVGTAAAAAGKQYLDFADPLNRAARNLDLNVELTAALDKQLRALAGTASVFTPQDQAEGLYLWAAATGAVVDDVGELTSTLSQAESVQKLAKLGNVSYGQAVEATTDVLSQYQKNVSETDSVVATLVKVAAVSKAEVGDLAEAFSYAGARADQSNTSFEETAAVFQLLSAFGLRGSSAGRGIARLLENLIAPSQQAKQEMDALFQSAFGRTDMLTTAEGQFVGLGDAITVLADATAGLTEAERAEFVARITTQNAARALVPLLELERKAREGGIDAIQATQDMLEGVENANVTAFQGMMEATTGYEVDTASAIETLNRYWDQYLNSVDGRADSLKASFSASMVDVGKAVVDSALPHIEKLDEALSGVAEKIAEDPDLVGKVLGGAAAVGGIGALASLAGKGIRVIADIKTIAMARQMYSAAVTGQANAQKQVQASQQQVVASNNQLKAANIQAADVDGDGVVGGAPTMSRGAKLAQAAVAATTAVFIADQAAQVIVGKTIGDLISTKAEQEEAMRDASAKAQEMTIAEMRAEITRLDQLKSQLEEWGETGNLLFGQLSGGPGWAEVPDEFKGIAGLPSGRLIAEEWDEATAAIEAYQAAVSAAKVEAEALRLAHFGTGLYEPPEMEPLAGQQTMLDEMSNLAVMAAQVEDAFGGGLVAWDGISAQNAILIGELQSQAESWRMLEGVVPGAEDALASIEAQIASLSGTAQALDVDAIAQALDLAAGRPSVSIGELAGKAYQAGGAGWKQYEGLVGTLPDEKILEQYDAYIEGLKGVYQEAASLSEREGQLLIANYEKAMADKVASHKQAQDEMTQATEQAIKDQQQLLEQAQQGFRNLVAQNLQPTEVTRTDVLATDAGTYADKWDEAARRMKAAVQDPMSEWRKALIPEDVLAGGEQAIALFGQQYLDQFYAGMRPDDINWDAFAAQVQQGLNQALSKEALLDRAVAELGARGIQAEDADVMAALGLQSPMERLLTGGLSPEEMATNLQTTMSTAVSGISLSPEDMAMAAGGVGPQIMAGITTSLSTQSFGDAVVGSFSRDIAKKAKDIRGIGASVGDLFWSGFRESMDSAGFIDYIVSQVLQELAGVIGMPSGTDE